VRMVGLLSATAPMCAVAVLEFGVDKLQCNMVSAVIACTIGRPFCIFWHVRLLHCTHVACIQPSSLGRPLCVISHGLLLRLCQT
jgi:hypothetical protein